MSFEFTTRLKPSKAYEYFTIETSTPVRIDFAWSNSHALLISPCHPDSGMSGMIPALTWTKGENFYTCVNHWDFARENGTARCDRKWHLPNNYMGTVDAVGNNRGFISRLEVWLESVGELSTLESAVAIGDFMESFDRFSEHRVKLRAKGSVLMPEDRLALCSSWNDNS